MPNVILLIYWWADVLNRLMSFRLAHIDSKEIFL